MKARWPAGVASEKRQSAAELSIDGLLGSVNNFEEKYRQMDTLVNTEHGNRECCGSRVSHHTKTSFNPGLGQSRHLLNSGSHYERDSAGNSRQGTLEGNRQRSMFKWSKR
ncbi:hypothetical protein PoB_000110800 [Plakobranchus ocellatus]|uniref:Uncharacterized protein n=1 Tax=Plakobranchus ocellatus TaxID=259542 RepID=A0AAV3XX84_9GAST|nr:hypothetical protein PoB_000110800 [Plakobranchus ocellatus]